MISRVVRLPLIASVALLLLPLPGIAAEPGPRLLWMQKFADEPYGLTPGGWIDLRPLPPSRGWIVDGRGALRFVHKLETGLLAYDGYFCNGAKAELADADIDVLFHKTADDDVTFGVAGRIVDRNNFYVARLSGDDRLELLKVVAGREVPLDVRPPSEGFAPRRPGLVTLKRVTAGRLRLRMVGAELEATVYDSAGAELARIAARDTTFARGRIGLCATPFAAAVYVHVAAPKVVTPTKSLEQITRRNQLTGEADFDLPVAQLWRWEAQDAEIIGEWNGEPFDVVVAGAGCGGWAAAVQASRLGAKVLLLEETDWIGGQMGAAAVTSMDEDGVRGTYAVRERGLYREFHESMTAYYHTLDKDPLVAYFSWPEQREGGYEPHVARNMLWGFFSDPRVHATVWLQSRVTAVQRDGDRITGVTVSTGLDKPQERRVACRVLIDATEYGDVIPLTGARYRVGNSLSDRIDPAALVQDHTWVAVLREYPQGVPPELQIKEPPPGYEEYAARRWKKYTNEGPVLWGAAGKGVKGERNWRVYFAWRGMADSESPLVGRMSAQRHTQCGFNGGNDYPVTAATIEDPAQRLRDEREGIYRSLGALYYFQQRLGVPWSLDADEGYDTPYNRAKMKRLNLRPDLEKLAVHLPQQPYVRECRRIVGVKTLVAADMGRYEKAKHWPTSIALGDYFMDLDHGRTSHAVEADLDGGLTEEMMPRGGGPFQVPLETLVPERIDGFLAAEKNISQSRLVNGATRLQPITMLTGQAAGALAALAVKQNKQPRDVSPRDVQRELLAAGSTLIQRWYSDVPWRSELWQATQLLALYGVMDRPMQIDENGDTPLGEEAEWGAAKPVDRAEMRQAVARIAALRGLAAPQLTTNDAQHVTRAELKATLAAAEKTWQAWVPEDHAESQVTAGEFAVIAFRLLAAEAASR